MQATKTSQVKSLFYHFRWESKISTSEKYHNFSATEDDDNEESDGIIFKLKKWNQVMIWSWNVNEDTCAICNISIIDSCPRVCSFRIHDYHINPSKILENFVRANFKCI